MYYKFLHKLRSIADGDLDFKDLLKGSFITFLSKISVVVSGLGVNFIIARFYGAHLLGITAIISTIISVFTILSLCGLNVSLLKLIPQFRVKYSILSLKELYKRSAILVLVLSILITLIIIITSGFVSENIFHKNYLRFYIIISALFIIPSVFCELNSSILKSLKLARANAEIYIISNFLKVIILAGVTFFIIIHDIPIYIILLFILVPFFLSYLKVENSLKNLKEDNEETKVISYKELFIFSFPMLLTASANITISYISFLILGIHRSESEVGIYSISDKLAIVTSFILYSVNTISAPKFSELYTRGKQDEFIKMVRKSSRLTLLASMPLTFIYVFFGEYILSFFGKEYIVGYYALIMLAAGKFVSAACGSVGYFLNTVNHEKVYQNIVIAGAIFSLFLNYLLIPVYGMNGAAFSTMAGFIFINITALLYIKIKFKFWTI